MTENVPYPMPLLVASGTVTLTEGEQTRTLDVSVTMPATTPTDIVLQVFGQQLQRKAALAAGLADLDTLPTTEDQ